MNPTPKPQSMERYTSDGSLAGETVKLFESSRERQKCDDQASLYAIIVATEHLERAFARDAVNDRDYTAQCNKLISQFRLAEKAACGDDMTTETFMHIYQMDCPRARERLLVMGVPEPIKPSSDDHSKVAVTVAETVQYFITTMDAVKLEQRAVDELQPLLSDLMETLTRLPETPNDFEPNRRIEKWLKKLNAMRAVEEITEEDSRQLYLDL